jgi:enoyl-CoA hydratase
MTDSLLFTVERRIATLTLNRPDKRNALSMELIDALLAAFERAAADPDVGAILLTGAGDKAFCAGAELAPAASDGPLEAHARRRRFATLLWRMARCEKPIVGAANGHALGGGFGLLLACDLVVARHDTRYGTPEIRRGLFPMMILPVLLRVLGRRRTLELALTGREVGGRELESWGAVNRSVEAGEVLPVARELAAALASMPAGVLALGRRALLIAEDLPLEGQLEYLCSQLTLNTLAEDAAEGVRAFLEKRPPTWSGR